MNVLYRLLFTSLFLFVMLGLHSCCGSKELPSSEIQYLGKKMNGSSNLDLDGATKWENGTIWLIATGYGKNKKSAELDAEVNAIETILFRGIPGSAQKSPMIPNEVSARKEYNYFLTNLLKSQGYMAHILERSPTETPQMMDWCRKKKVCRTRTKLKINLYSLRKSLEDAGVSRKFGL